jgi:hypothetical protein
MKHLKSYESLNELVYFWRIKVKQPYLEYSLIKLGATKIQIHHMLNNSIFIEDEYIYVAINSRKTEKDYISWNPYSRSGYNDYIEDGYIYKGILDITLEEIEFMKNQNKYNL